MEQARLETLLEHLQTTKSIEELQVWAHELRDHYGIAHVAYHTVKKSGEHVGAFTYELDWARRYVERDYVNIDPVVRGAARSFHPMDWKTLDWSGAPARAFLKEALAHGIGNQGLTIPIWGPHGEYAIFSVNDRTSDAAWAAFTGGKRSELLVVSHAMHQQAMRIINKETGLPTTDLSPREREALSLLSLGKSRSEVADDLSISENTLRAYIDSARHKLGALNVTHAVALAMARGVIATSSPLPKY